MTQLPNDADGDALRRVAEHADLSKPMKIDFAVVVPNEAAARGVAEVANQHGYSASVEHDEQDDSWACYCMKEMLATHEGVTRAQDELDRLSAPFGGRTDGWGTFGNDGMTGR